MTDVYKAPEAELRAPSEPGQYGSVEKALAGDYDLKPVEVIKQAWANLKGMKTAYWIAMIIYIVVALLISGINIVVFGMPDPNETFRFSDVIMNVVSALVLTPMAAGLFMIGLRHSVGAQVKFDEIFKHYDKMVPLFLMTILMSITIVIGLILLVLPGIYLMVAYMLAIPLIVDKGMGPWEALNTSRKAITHKWFAMFGFVLLAIVIVIVASIPLLIGLIWALPLLTLAAGIIYRDMFGVEASTLA